MTADLILALLAKIDMLLTAATSLSALAADLKALTAIPGYGTEAGMSDADLAKVRAGEAEVQAKAQAMLDSMT